MRRYMSILICCMASVVYAEDKQFLISSESYNFSPDTGAKIIFFGENVLTIDMNGDIYYKGSLLTNNEEIVYSLLDMINLHYKGCLRSDMQRGLQLALQQHRTEKEQEDLDAKITKCLPGG